MDSFDDLEIHVMLKEMVNRSGSSPILAIQDSRFLIVVIVVVDVFFQLCLPKKIYINFVFCLYVATSFLPILCVCERL